MTLIGPQNFKDPRNVKEGKHCDFDIWDGNTFEGFEDQPRTFQFSQLVNNG